MLRRLGGKSLGVKYLGGRNIDNTDLTPQGWGEHTYRPMVSPVHKMPGQAGRWIRWVRENQDPPMSRARLARALEVTEATVENWEKGENEPAIQSMERMCSLFGYGLPWLDWDPSDNGTPLRPGSSVLSGWPMADDTPALALAGR